MEGEKNFMAFPDEPEKGGSKDGNHMEKEESWQEVSSKCKTATNRGKGWGKGSAVHGKDAQFHVQLQGLERKSTVHDFFKDNKMHVLPVIVCTLNGNIASMYDISNKDILYETRMNAQEAVKQMHKVLTSEHGPLDLAPKPVCGNIIPLRIKIENHQGLFAEPEWYQVLEEILKTDFIGFLPGSPVEVISVTGMPPICTMTCLAFKSAKIQELQKNPIVNATYTMFGSRSKVKCSLSFLEMPLSCPMKGEPAVSLQIIQPYLNHKDFDAITARYKDALAPVLHRGIWKALPLKDVMQRFSICKVPRSQRYIARKESKKVYVLEVFGFSDGDVKHIIDSIKLQDRITVPCCDRAYGEDESGDSRYPPATLIYHRSGIAALKATLEHKHKAALDDIKNAASRVEKLIRCGKV